MHIDIFRRRRGELGLEAIMILPVAIIVILLSRFILEGMLVRQEIAVFTRSGTAAAAQADSTMPIYCTADRDPFAERPAVTQTAQIACRDRPAEQGLTTQRPFWDAIRTGARPWPRILRDIDLEEDLKDMQGNGAATSAFTSPSFLAGIGALGTDSAALFPRAEVWNHADEPLRSSYDPVIWDALREQGTWRLFPEVFPARDN